MSRSLGSRIRKSRKKKSAPPLKTSLKRGSKSPTRAGQKYSRKASSKKAPAKKAAPKKPQREVGKPKYSQAGDYGDELTAAYMAGVEMATPGVGTPLSPAAEAYLEANFKGIPIPEGGESLPISPTQTYSESDKPFSPDEAPPVGRLAAGATPTGEAIQAPGGSLFANIQGTSAPPQSGAVVAVPVEAAPQSVEVADIPASDIGETDPVGSALSGDPAMPSQDQTEKLKQIIRRDVARKFASLLFGGKKAKN